MHFSLVAVVGLATSVVAHNFLISGDDGWATAQARAQYNSLVAAGFDVWPFASRCTSTAC